MTHIERQRKLMEATQQDIMTVMRINENKYNDTFYESGIRYTERLEEEMKKHKQNIPQAWARIRISQHFWKWWRVQFNLKNQVLLSEGYHSEEAFIKAHAANTVIIPKHVMNQIFPES
jgi:hypothetical protein